MTPVPRHLISTQLASSRGAFSLSSSPFPRLVSSQSLASPLFPSPSPSPFLPPPLFLATATQSPFPLMCSPSPPLVLAVVDNAFAQATTTPRKIWSRLRCPSRRQVGSLDEAAFSMQRWNPDVSVRSTHPCRLVPFLRINSCLAVPCRAVVTPHTHTHTRARVRARFCGATKRGHRTLSPRSSNHLFGPSDTLSASASRLASFSTLRRRAGWTSADG